MPNEIDPVITRQNAAAVLTISIDTLERLIKRGKLKAIPISERRKGILASEIKRFQESQAASAA